MADSGRGEGSRGERAEGAEVRRSRGEGRGGAEARGSAAWSVTTPCPMVLDTSSDDVEQVKMKAKAQLIEKEDADGGTTKKIDSI